jgi:spermidine synthase
MPLFSRQRKGAQEPVQVSERQGVRFMHLGGPAVQSAMRIKEPWALELEYTRAMLGFLLFFPYARDIALIGLGGGSIAKFIHRNLPEVRLTALEINPDVVAAARAYFLLPADDERLEVQVGDGAAYVHANPSSQDVLLVDGYDAKRIVEALSSLDFYQACKAMLRPGGVAVFNLWGSDEYFPRYFERIAAAFGEHVLQLPSEKKGNIIVFAFRKPLPNVGFTVLERAAEKWQVALNLEFPDFVSRMRHWNPVGERGFVL